LKNIERKKNILIENYFHIINYNALLGQ